MKIAAALSFRVQKKMTILVNRLEVEKLKRVCSFHLCPSYDFQKYDILASTALIMYLGSLFKNFQYCLNKMSPGAQTPPIWTVLADGNRTQIWKIATKFLHV